jgi:hypothetical protein
VGDDVRRAVHHRNRGDHHVDGKDLAVEAFGKACSSA